MNKFVFLIALLAVISSVGDARCSDSSFFHGLIWGPYPIGYKVRYFIDSSRTFQPGYDPAGSIIDSIHWRKLPISIWYPGTDRSEAKRISYAQYFISSGEKPGSGAISDVIDSVIEMILRDQISSGQKDIDRQKLRDILADKPEVYLDADPAKGPFPLILGAPGAWNPAIDNSILYEYLASNGYVVAASPSIGFSTEAMSLDWEGVEAQTRDLEFIVSRMSRNPAVDISRIGAIGFSWGGMAAITCAGRSHFIDAVVSIDGSATLAHRIKLLESFPFVNSETYTAPTLFILAHSDDSLRHSLEFYNNLKYSDAWVFRLSPNTHGNCTSYGINVFSRTDDHVYSRYLNEIKTGYETLCRLSLSFLDCYVKSEHSRNWPEEP